MSARRIAVGTLIVALVVSISLAESRDANNAPSNFQQADTAYARKIVATPGLKAFWSFDDLDNTLRDRLGLQNGTYTNPLPRGRGGVSGSSIRFQGTDQRYGSVSARSGQSFSQWSLEFWVMPSISQNGWMIWHVPSSGKGYAVQLASIGYKLSGAQEGVGVLPGVCITTKSTGDVKCSNEAESQPGPTAVQTAESVGAEKAGTPYATVGRWSHVVATFDGSQEYPTLYVGGQKVLSSTTSRSQATPMNSSGIYFGRTNMSGYGPADNAGLDEVALYNRVLTSAEIQEHYLAGVEELQRLDLPVVTPMLYADYLPAGFQLERVLEAKPQNPLPTDVNLLNAILPPKERSVIYSRTSPLGTIDVTTRTLDSPDAAAHLFWGWRHSQQGGTYYGTTTVRGNGAFVVDLGGGRGADVWWQESDYVVVVVGGRGKSLTAADMIQVAQSVRDGDVCDLVPEAC